jgi:hypothetical protein
LICKEFSHRTDLKIGHYKGKIRTLADPLRTLGKQGAAPTKESETVALLLIDPA